MKRKFLIFFCVACLFAGNMYGQSPREHQWSFQPRFGNRSILLNMAYGALANGLDAGFEDSETWQKIVPFLPATYLCIDAPISMKTPDGKVAFDYGNVWKKYYLWNFCNYSIGFELSWQKRRFPVGLFLDCDYKHYLLDMKLPGEDIYSKYITQSIVPALGLRSNFGSFMQKVNPVIELGAAYNYNFSFEGKYGNDKNAVKNGITGIYGVGVEFPALRSVLTIRYLMNHYNYFNENYTPDKGITYPYKGVKSTIGCFNLSFSKRF